MPRALNLIRDHPTARRQLFDEGIRAAGFRQVDRIQTVEPGDLLLTWNRYSSADDEARRFETAGGYVVVVENPFLPLPGWYAMAVGHHAGLGKWPVGGPERWESLGIRLHPWREGTETVILGQRSIGERGIASPRGWEEEIQRKVGGRIRKHPGRDVAVPLEQDLAKARCAVTWGSAAAIQALIFGVPVFYGLQGWIMESCSRHVDEWSKGPFADDLARLQAFERLAWAMSPSAEIESGKAILRLCGFS